MTTLAGKVIEEKRRTLGGMTAAELIDSARSELKGLEEHLSKSVQPIKEHDIDWIALYLTSIHARLIVAENKLKDVR